MQFVPPRCPNPCCSNHLAPQDKFFRRKGYYAPRCRLERVPRFVCLTCRRWFSRQTFRHDYRDRRPDCNDQLFTLLEASGTMPGCLSYVIAKDPEDEHAIWITEVWESTQDHRASVSLPSVQQAIKRGKPLIASFGSMTATEPVGGHGLVRAAA